METYFEDQKELLKTLEDYVSEAVIMISDILTKNFGKVDFYLTDYNTIRFVLLDVEWGKDMRYSRDVYIKAIFKAHFNNKVKELALHIAGIIKMNIEFKDRL